jgi:hypothetical protein
MNYGQVGGRFRNPPFKASVWGCHTGRESNRWLLELGLKPKQRASEALEPMSGT